MTKDEYIKKLKELYESAKNDGQVAVALEVLNILKGLDSSTTVPSQSPENPIKMITDYRVVKEIAMAVFAEEIKKVKIMLRPSDIEDTNLVYPYPGE